MRLVATVVALASCGTSSQNSVDGIVGGQSLAIAQAVWTVAPVSMRGEGTGNAAFVLMSTEPSLCDRAGSNTVIPGEKTVSLEIVDVAGTAMTAPAGSGSYIVPIESTLAPKTAWLGTDSYDAQCVHTGTGAARSGLVTVASVDSNAITGSFDVAIDTVGGAPVTGTFAPTYCPGLANALQDTLPACQP
jgi:hypothetical protein